MNIAHCLTDLIGNTPLLALERTLPHAHVLGKLEAWNPLSSAKDRAAWYMVLDAEEHTAYLNGEEISLTVREFNLIYKLLSYPKKTFTRSQLMDEFWDSASTSGPRTVDVYMTKLRDKFSDCKDFEIVTVHGLGYKAVLK